MEGNANAFDCKAFFAVTREKKSFRFKFDDDARRKVVVKMVRWRRGRHDGGGGGGGAGGNCWRSSVKLLAIVYILHVTASWIDGVNCQGKCGWRKRSE